jgi:hypothetical protein
MVRKEWSRAGMVRKEWSRAGMVTVGMVTEGMVYCFNGLGKNGLKKLKVKSDENDDGDGETTRVIYELFDGKKFFREQMRGNVVLYN